MSTNASGTVIGWLRIGAVGGSVLAVDMKLEMRADGGSWLVTNVMSREHCAVALVDDDCR